MNIKKIHKFYSKNDFRFIKILKNTKRPSQKWKESASLTLEQLERVMSKKQNLAVVPPPDLMVMDVDCGNGKKGLESFERMKRDLQILDEDTIFKPHTKTRNNGMHIIFKTSKPLNKKSKISKYKDIDFKWNSGYVLVEPSQIDGKKYEFLGNETIQHLPAELQQFFEKSKEEKPLKSLSKSPQGRTGEDGVSYQRHSFSKTKELLRKVDSDCSYGDWIKVGMALKSEINNEKGLRLFQEWSRKGKKHKEGEPKEKWETFDKEKKEKPITMGSLHFLAGETKGEKTKSPLLDFFDNEDSKKILKKVRELIVEMKETTCEKDLHLRVDFCKKLRMNKMICKNFNFFEIMHEIFLEFDKKFFSNFYFSKEDQQFFDFKKNIFYEKSVFNDSFSEFVPIKNRSYVRPKASEYALQMGLTQKFDSFEFRPTEKNKVFFEKKKKKLNTFLFCPPLSEEEITLEGEEFMMFLKLHISCLVGSKNADLFLDWIAHQKQNQGKLLRFCPYLMTFQGMGKSVIERLLEILIGEDLLGHLEGSSFFSDFQSESWLKKKTVTICKEFYTKFFHTRETTINKFKSYLTDSKITINEKFKNTKTIRNNVNFIFFSNSTDFLRLEKDDRRFWALCSNFENREMFSKWIKKTWNFSPEKYYGVLFDGIEKFKKQIRKHFSQHKISEKFQKQKTAFLTEEKKNIFRNSLEEEFGFAETKYVLQDFEGNGKGFGCFSVCSNELYKTVLKEYKKNVRRKNKSLFLKHLGFVKFKRIQIGSKKHDIWVKKDHLQEATPESIRNDQIPSWSE